MSLCSLKWTQHSWGEKGSWFVVSSSNKSTLTAWSRPSVDSSDHQSGHEGGEGQPPGRWFRIHYRKISDFYSSNKRRPTRSRSLDKNNDVIRRQNLIKWGFDWDFGEDLEENPLKTSIFQQLLHRSCFRQRLKPFGSIRVSKECLQKREAATRVLLRGRLHAAACRSSERDTLAHIITTLSTIRRHLTVQDNHHRVHWVAISTVQQRTKGMRGAHGSCLDGDHMVQLKAACSYCCSSCLNPTIACRCHSSARLHSSLSVPEGFKSVFSCVRRQEEESFIPKEEHHVVTECDYCAKSWQIIQWGILIASTWAPGRGPVSQVPGGPSASVLGGRKGQTEASSAGRHRALYCLFTVPFNKL